MPSLADRLAALSHVRGARAVAGPGGGRSRYKEWLHFCVLAPTVDLFINFSLAADDEAAPPAGEVARVMVRACEAEARAQCHGAVETVDARSVFLAPSGLDLDLGGNRLRWCDDAFELRARAGQPAVSVRLRLVPGTTPLLELDRPLGSGRASWLVLPTLAATGSASVAGRTHELRDAPAYHTHHWGAWRWGDDFAWQWAFALSTNGDGAALAYGCTSDRARSHAGDVRLCAWRDGRITRVFHGDAVHVEAETGAASSTLALAAAHGSDRLRCRLHTDARAELRVSDEDGGDGATRVSEATGVVTVDGVLDGRDERWQGRGAIARLDVDG